MEEKKKKENPTLPSELIVEILLRLPVRSLLRCKSVCKAWYFLLSQSRIAEMHFDLAAVSTRRLLLNLTFDNEVESVDIEASLHDDSASLNLSIVIPDDGQNKNNSLEILCSCRGFILLVNDDGDLFVWNPATRVHKQIPYCFDFRFDILRGIGYDPSTDDYFVVLIGLDHPEMDLDYCLPPRLEFFSFNTNTICKIKGVNLRYMEVDFDFRSGLYLNGALHWLVISTDMGLPVIIAFNLADMTLSEIHLSPALAMEFTQKLYYLRVMGGCLSMCHCGEGDGNAMAEIWIMKDYEVQSSWTKTTVLSTHDIPQHLFFPICFTEGGGVIGSNGHGRLMKFNDKGELLEFRTYRPEYKHALLYCGMYRESLQSLPSDWEEASEVEVGEDEDEVGEDETSEDEDEDEAGEDETSEDDQQ